MRTRQAKKILLLMPCGKLRYSGRQMREALLTFTRYQRHGKPDFFRQSLVAYAEVFEALHRVGKTRTFPHLTELLQS